MRPADNWEYNYENTAVHGNMYNATNDMAAAILLPHESSAGDGTSGSMQDRVEWMDMRIREMHEAIVDGQQAVGQASIDIEKLAEKVAKKTADEIYARLAK